MVTDGPVGAVVSTVPSGFWPLTWHFRPSAPCCSRRAAQGAGELRPSVVIIWDRSVPQLRGGEMVISSFDVRVFAIRRHPPAAECSWSAGGWRAGTRQVLHHPGAGRQMPR